MSDVTSAKHSTRTPGLGAAWAVLIGTGVTSVTYNVVHAVPVLDLALALLLGFAPAFVAACLSHVAAVLDAPGQVKAAVTAVMLGGMVLSASNTAAVVAPAEPGWRGWLFGIILDAGALLALWAIMASRRRKAQAEGDREQARAEAEASAAVAREATARAGDLERELAAVKAELGAELERATAEAEAARLRISARKPKRRPARKPAGIPARATAGISGAASGAEDDDLDAEAAALKLWMADRTIPGSQLGPMVGRTDSWGRGAVRKFKQTAPDRQAG